MNIDRKRLSIIFFYNGGDNGLRDFVLRMKEVGYIIQIVPTTGPSTLWVQEYEVVGKSEIENLASQLISATA